MSVGSTNVFLGVLYRFNACLPTQKRQKRRDPKIPSGVALSLARRPDRRLSVARRLARCRRSADRQAAGVHTLDALYLLGDRGCMCLFLGGSYSAAQGDHALSSAYRDIAGLDGLVGGKFGFHLGGDPGIVDFAGHGLVIRRLAHAGAGILSDGLGDRNRAKRSDKTSSDQSLAN